ALVSARADAPTRGHRPASSGGCVCPCSIITFACYRVFPERTLLIPPVSLSVCFTQKGVPCMDFELPEEHQLAYESALAFALNEIAPHNTEIERSDDFPPWIWKRLAAQGYTGIAIPEEYGGSGGDFLMAALVARAIGRANGGISMSFGAHLNLCEHNIMRNGTEEQKATYLPKLVSTEMIGGLGLTEPNAGSDAMGIQTTARATEGGYLLNGTKVFITNGPIADLLIIYAKTKPEAGSRGITAFIFETNTPGYHVARKLEKLGMHGSPTGELVFEDAFVPETNVLGKVNEGFKVVMSGLDLERADRKSVV